MLAVLAALLAQRAAALVENTGAMSGSSNGFVVAGRRFSYLVTPQSGAVQATGQNHRGQLGIGGFADQNRPEPVSLPDGAWAVDAAAGAFHGLFVTDAGLAFATGWNRFGQFGIVSENISEQEDVPVQVHEGVQAVAAGYGHSLFLMNDGAVEAAGLNNAGQLGDGTTVSRSTRVTALSADPANPVVSIAAGYDFSYFLRQNGDVYAVGQNLGGQLGDGTRATRLSPVQVSITGVSRIAAGDSHALFKKDTDAVFGTGANAAIQLGVQGLQHYTTPTQIEFGSLAEFGDARHIFCGGDSSCVQTDGALRCSGSNLDGQIGLATNSIIEGPTTVYRHGDRTHASDMAIGDSHSIMLDRDYSLFLVSGTNANGELGDGTNEDSSEFKIMQVDFTATTSITATATETRTTTLTLQPQTTVTREPSADELDIVTMLLTVIGVAVGAVFVFVFVRRLSRSGGGEEDVEAEDFGDLELVRAGMENA